MRPVAQELCHVARSASLLLRPVMAVTCSPAWPMPKASPSGSQRNLKKAIVPRVVSNSEDPGQRFRAWNVLVRPLGCVQPIHPVGDFRSVWLLEGLVACSDARHYFAFFSLTSLGNSRFLYRLL